MSFEGILKYLHAAAVLSCLVIPIQVARYLEMGLVLDVQKNNPEFLQAFEANEITWDTDPEPLRQRAQNIEQGVYRNWPQRMSRVDKKRARLTYIASICDFDDKI